MRVLIWLTALALVAGGKKQMTEKEMFSSQSLKCLVCQKMIVEFEWAFSQTDPQKKVEVGSFRLTPSGASERRVVSYYCNGG